jgi:hypothetical protein
MNAASWSLPLLSGLFVSCAGIVAVLGVGMARAARYLARRIGLGEVPVGGVLVGAATSLSGITTSVTAAWSGHAGLAVRDARRYRRTDSISRHRGHPWLPGRTGVTVCRGAAAPRKNSSLSFEETGHDRTEISQVHQGHY